MTNSQDSGPGSLRAALVEAAAQPGVNITFDLPTSDAGYDAKSNDWTIRPTTALPALGTGTSLNAETQPGTRLSPRVVLDGTLLTASEPPADGLTFTASGATARGLRIVRFPGHGVRLTADRAGVAANNTLRACIVGLDANGLAAPNALGGVRLDQGAHHNLIGGPAPADRCVLSGNGGRGLLLTGTGTDANTVSGCYIGTDESGTAARPNALEGVAILDGATGNLIGTAEPGGGNLISGNNLAGVFIYGVGTKENRIEGNAIGTNGARIAALPNHAEGVAISGGAQQNFVGYGFGGNLISGNLGAGVTVSGAGSISNAILGNRIGTNSDGTSAIPNQGNGVAIYGDSGGFSLASIGGQFLGGDNLISGNIGHGVSVSDRSAANVENNRIGLNAAGTMAIPNGGSGVAVFGSAWAQIGTDVLNVPPNFIAGNAKDGVTVSGAATARLVCNYIGTDATGTFEVANGLAGIAVRGGGKANVGNGVTGLYGGTEGNLICGSADQTGLTVDGAGSSARVGGNVFRGHGSSVVLSGGCAAILAGNAFRDFALSGIEVRDSATTGSFLGNLFSIGSRVLVDLVGGSEDGRGQTANDVGDLDNGPNGLLNHPTVASAAQQGNGTRIQGAYSGLAQLHFRLDFYSANTAGEIASWVGSAELSTDAAGSANFDVVLPSIVRAGRQVIATATTLGDTPATSEFSSPATVTIVDTDGDGLPDDYEIAQGLNPLDPADAQLDFDGDGASNFSEYRGGTDPRSARSVFSANFGLAFFFQYAVTFEAVGGRAYALESSLDLSADDWITVTPLISFPFTQPQATFVPPHVPVLPTAQYPFIPPPQRVFYRVRLLP